MVHVIVMLSMINSVHLPSPLTNTHTHTVRWGKLELVKYLIEVQRCFAGCTDNIGKTPLHLVCGWVCMPWIYVYMYMMSVMMWPKESNAWCTCTGLIPRLLDERKKSLLHVAHTRAWLTNLWTWWASWSCVCLMARKFCRELNLTVWWSILTTTKCDWIWENPPYAIFFRKLSLMYGW